MCENCNYTNILKMAGVEATVNRVSVLETIGNNNCPLTAMDIFNVVERTLTINKVTVYRILDLLVGKNILERLSSGNRSTYFGMAPNENHISHPHFYCTTCGRMDCLNSASIAIDTEQLLKTFPGRIENIAVRVDGICKNCLKEKMH
jgi:Fur family ferric uptake transcriptional regulator